MEVGRKVEKRTEKGENHMLILLVLSPEPVGAL